MDFWQAIISYVIPLLSIVVGLVAIFISVRLSRTTEKALDEIKRNLDKKVGKSIKSLEDANKYIRESSANIQTDLIDLIKDSHLPNDQLISHARSDTDFIVSNLDSLEIKILRACEKFPGSTPRFTPGKSKTPDPKPKAGKKFKDYLKGKNQEEADTSISKLIGFELIDFVTNPKKPTERILKLTEKGCGIVTILRERKLLPD